MPLYEYICQSCQHEFEYLVRGNDKPACPQCGAVKLEKQFSVPAAHSGGQGSQLPVCGPTPSPGNCGLPQCGMGGCQFE